MLDNTNEYKRDGSVRLIKTKNISDWLKLAAELESVNINSWRFGDAESAAFCEPIADEYNSDSKHYTDYSTAITRFIFVCNALEEIYRFVDLHYQPIKSHRNKELKEPSMRAAFLIDEISKNELPIHFEHLIKNFTINFDFYKNKYKPHISGVSDESSDQISYGLHLVRNLRNYIAHGTFPLLDNPEYWGDESTKIKLITLLVRASRVACIYIQIFLFKYNHGFQSELYDYSTRVSNEDAYFVDNCKIDLALTLHTKSDFTFQDPEGYHIDNDS